MKPLLLAIILFLVHAHLADIRALELYSLIQSECRFSTGLIIQVDPHTVILLNTDGTLDRVKRTEIEHILVFNTLDNPISRLDFQGELTDYLRQIEVQGDAGSGFTGWPIRFLENLIVFYDSEGKTHLVDVDKIQRFTYPESPRDTYRPIKQFKQVRFGFGNNLPECAHQADEPGDRVQPTRMISDTIALSKFLAVYETGFRKLNRLQKRTSFYARPFLYEEKIKVGIVVDREDFQEELPALMPLNFQWPTGSNYGAQGILNLGSNANLNLPNVEPVFGVNFSGKYHFLSVYFSGNIWGFSYGQDFMIKNRALFKDFFSRRDADDILVLPQYNQLAMTGLEWGPYSVSGGYYYPVIGLQANGIFREILSQQSMPIAGIKYTTAASRFQVLLSDMTTRSDSPADSNINLIYAGEMAQGTSLSPASEDLRSSMEGFDLHSRFLRINYDLELSRDISLGFSEVLFQGTYEETLAESDYSLEFRHAITSIRLQQEFGDYVALKGYLNYFIRHYQSKSIDHDKKTENNALSFTVVVEFIL